MSLMTPTATPAAGAVPSSAVWPATAEPAGGKPVGGGAGEGAGGEARPPLGLVKHAVAFALSLFAAILSLWMFTRHIDFPITYHPDEKGKAQQLLTGHRNFRHPQLLLQSARLAAGAAGGVDDARAAVLVGRWTSGALAAVAVFALSLAAYASHGFVGLAVAGAAVMLCPPLHVYARYFKEETALVAGVALSVLGARGVMSARGTGWQLAAAALLGLGCAAAVSGKLVGMAVLLPAAAALVLAPGAGRWLSPGRCAAFGVASVSAVAGALLFNAPALSSVVPPVVSPEARAALWKEVEHGTTGHVGVTMDVPNTYVLRIAFSELMPHLWIAAAWAASLLIMGRLTVGRWGGVLMLFLATFAVELAFGRIPIPRYALPVTVVAYYIAAEMTVAACRAMKPRLAVPLIALALGAIIVGQGGRCAALAEQFRDDSRQRLREWMARHVPAQAVIVAEAEALLGSGGDPWRHPHQAPLALKFLSVRSPAEVHDTISGLSRRGVEYVVIAEPRYQLFLDRASRAIPGQEEQFDRHRRLYRELLDHGDLVWASIPPVPSHSYVNPELRVYRVKQAAVRATTGGTSG